MLGRIFDFDAQAFNLNHYQALPDNWSIAIADVISSTTLAAEGRDKDVNFVAAAAVAVLTQELESDGEPAAIQFGGDGVIAAVPPQHQESVRKRLAALAYWSASLFDISLRVGMVPVANLNAADLPCYASLQVLDQHNAFGLFLGDGIQAADDWVKRDLQWNIEPAESELPGLENLSCRWDPVKSSRGLVVSLIVDPVAKGNLGISALDDVIQRITVLIPANQASPLGNVDALKPPVIPSWKSVSRELKTQTDKPKIPRIFAAYMSSFILWSVWRLGGKLGRINAKRYLNSLSRKTDFRKQAGGPRMVLDLTYEEFDTMVKLLNQAEADGGILFGYATSEAATLTCLVGDFQADDHIHFIDGQGLGFWRASVMLKEKRISRA